MSQSKIEITYVNLTQAFGADSNFSANYFAVQFRSQESVDDRVVSFNQLDALEQVTENIKAVLTVELGSI